MAKDAKGHGSDKRGGGMTPVQSENAPFVSRLGPAAGHSFLDPRDPRGIAASHGIPTQHLDNIDKNLRGPGKHVGYGGGDTFHIQKSNGPKSNYYSAVGQRSGKVFTGKGLGEISRKLPK